MAIKKRAVYIASVVMVIVMFSLLFYEEGVAGRYYRKVEILFWGAMAVTGFLVAFPGSRLYRIAAKAADICISYRYLIALLLFVCLVAFKISGSSMNMLDAYFGEGGSEILFGSARGIRSDEWVVNTEFHFAQVYSDAFFPIINTNLGADGQNMLLACNSPVWHISLIGKPQTWGYFFLGAERGLSWFWWFRVFALLFGSYEMGEILTKRNKKLSLLLTILVGFSPVMLWWFSSSLVDIVIAGQWLFVGFYHFLFQKGNKNKILSAAVFTSAALGYVFSLYPAMQVPFGYLLLILMVYYLVAKRKEIYWRKTTTFIFAIAVAVIAITLLLFLKDTWEDIRIIMNTDYPGQSDTITGDRAIRDLFMYLIAFFLPFREITFSNTCEVSCPLLLAGALAAIAVCYIRKRGEKPNRVLVYILLVYTALLVSMCVVAYPQVFLKATFLSYVKTNRLPLIIGLGVSYALVLMIAEFGKGALIKKDAAAWLITGVSVAGYIAVMWTTVDGYISATLIFITAVVFGLIEHMLIRNRQKEALALLFITSAATSVFVNPIIRGADSMTGSQMIQTARQIDAEESGDWLILDTMVQQNVLAANGLRTINAVQYEPNLEYWSLFDEEGTYREIYNRYAHVTVELTDDETYFELIGVDWIKVYLSYVDIKKAGVDYMIAPTGVIDPEHTDAVTLEMIAQCPNGYDIYKVG